MSFVSPQLPTASPSTKGAPESELTNFDTLPSSLVNPLEGLTTWKCGRSWNLEPLPTSSTKGGKRGVLEVPGLD
jgi:hypothetical protein